MKKHEITVSATDLAAFTGEELWALRTSISTLVGVACAMCCQPKLGDHEANRAGLVIEQVVDTFNALNDAINAEAASRQCEPKKLSAHDARMLGFVTLGYQVEMRDDLSRVSVLAAQAVEVEGKAAFYSAPKAGA